MVKDKEETQTEKPVVSKTSKTKVFLFPQDGIAVEAKDRKEAEDIYKKTLKAKESDNG